MPERLTLWGDYSVLKARGRWTGSCYHCRYVSKPRGYAGHAESAVREHQRDAHQLYNPRQDWRERNRGRS